MKKLIFYILFILCAIGAYGQVTNKNISIVKTNPRVYFNADYIKVEANLPYWNTYKMLLSSDTAAMLLPYAPLASPTFTGTVGAANISATGGIQQKGEFNVINYGAVADSTTDCTAAFRAASAAAGNLGTVIIPPGAYILSDSVQITGNLEASGARIYVYDTNKVYFVLGRWGTDLYTYTFNHFYNTPEMIQRGYVVGSGWGTDIAIRLVRLNNCHITLGKIHGFGTGVQCNGSTTGFVYNKIYLGRIWNCKVGIHLEKYESGWTNDNYFEGGQIGADQAHGSGVAGHYAILFDGGTRVNGNNIFKKIGMEGDTWEYHIKLYGRYNVFEDCRFEGTTPKVDIQRYGAGSTSSYNKFTGYYAANITFSGDARSVSTTRLEYFNKWDFTTYDENYAQLNLSKYSSAESVYPVLNVWGSGYNHDNTGTNWGFSLGVDSLKTKTITDANARFTLFNKTGKMSWGGGAGATDVSLERSDVGELTIGGNAIINGDLALGANNLTMTGSIASDGSRVTKGWFTDIDVTNDVDVGSVAILKADSTGYLEGNYLPRKSAESLIKNTAANDLALKGLQAMGSDAKAFPLMAQTYLTTNGSLVDGEAYYMAFYLPDTMTLTGIKFIQRTQGNYTADNYNGAALYSVSGTTYTKVASTADDGDLWKQANYSLGTKAFSSQYFAQPGIYYVAILYNSSVETTPPELYFHNYIVTLGTLITGNTNKISGYIAAQASLPDSEVGADLNNHNATPGIWLY